MYIDGRFMYVCFTYVLGNQELNVHMSYIIISPFKIMVNKLLFSLSAQNMRFFRNELLVVNVRCISYGFPISIVEELREKGMFY